MHEEEASGALATRRRLDPGGEALNPHLAEAGKTGDEFSGCSSVDGGEARRRRGEEEGVCQRGGRPGSIGRSSGAAPNGLSGAGKKSLACSSKKRGRPR